MKLALALICVVAAARADDLERANALREQSGQDWNEKKYEDAAKKLRAADDIYKALGEKHNAQRAICQRALAWNLMRAGRLDEARDALAETIRLAKATDGLDGEVRSAYAAMFEAAKAAGNAVGASGVLDPVRERAERLEDFLLAAQVLHDLGFLAGLRGERERALDYYQRAATERRQLNDHLGAAWSVNNAAHQLLESGRPDAALAQLADALETVREHKVEPPQAAIGFNLRRACAEPAKLDKVETKVWERLIEASAAGDFPRIVPTPMLVAAALSAGKSVARARLAAELEQAGAPGEAAADVRIRAADATADAAQALVLLAKVEPGDGPCAPHLRARVDRAIALAHARSTEPDAEKLLAAANRAVAAFDDLEAFGDRQETARRLLAATKDASDPAVTGARESWKRLLNDGEPGGAGGSAVSAGNRNGFAKLGAHDPVFRVRFVPGDPGVIELTDLVVGQSWTYPITWKPRNVTINGVQFLLYGGYVRITSFAYDGAAVSSGAPGSVTLDGMGAYWPVTEKAFEIRKNGAVR